MPSSKAITTKIKSVQSTRKITKAMEMVSASKMKKAQDRMRATRPYVERTFNIVMHIAKANTEYHHPFLQPRDVVKRVGAIVDCLQGGVDWGWVLIGCSDHSEFPETEPVDRDLRRLRSLGSIRQIAFQHFALAKC